MKPPLYQLSYSALHEIWLPLLDSNQAARDQSPVPYQLGEGAIRMVPRAGFETRVSRFEGPVSSAIDERGISGAGGES